ncbi:YkgJ family cysteine cluster protein, partial [Planotetraspora phitsanulokensis]
MKRSEMDAQLQALYDQVPQPGCKGLCSDSCGPIGMNPRERQRIRERGVTIPHHEDALLQMAQGEDYSCPALKDGQCSVYEVRPMLCRLWGAAEAMPCPHGCQPDEGLLSDTKGSVLLAQSLDVGNPQGFTAEQMDRLERRMGDPKFQRTVKDYVQNNRRVATPDQAVEHWQGKAAEHGMQTPARP